MASPNEPTAPALTIRRLFQQRSGRVIALSRALLASFFTLAIALDPTQSDAWVEPALLLLSAYTLFSGLIFALTWKNWWLEARLAVPAHAVDLLVFAVLIALTEGYVSPFFTFFVFLVLSSTIRGGWREAALTTGAVFVLFVVAGWIAAKSGSQGLDIRRFIVRGAHLPILSFMIVWFGISQFGARRSRVAVPLPDGGEDDETLVRQALEHAAWRLDAGRVVLAWADSEEPWLYVDSFDSGKITRHKFGPDDFESLVALTFADEPFLFDLPRRHILLAPSGRPRTFADIDAIEPAFAKRFAIEAGVAVPISTSTHAGYLFSLAIPGPSSDDLRIATIVAEEISSAFERSVVIAANRDAAATRTRLALARDLHDSVVQFLAGMGLQLESLKKSIEGMPSAVEQIDALQQQLVIEQRDLRRLIGASRADQGQDHAGLREALQAVKTRLEQQWSIELVLALDESLERVPARLHYDIEQLIREGAANAARHGRAKRVTIAAAAADNALRLDISDDGDGFPVEGEFADDQLRHHGIGPRSLADRVHTLRGEIRLATSPHTGSHLAIKLPLGGDR